jgi:hypothetical protein
MIVWCGWQLFLCDFFEFSNSVTHHSKSWSLAKEFNGGLSAKEEL